MLKSRRFLASVVWMIVLSTLLAGCGLPSPVATGGLSTAGPTGTPSQGASTPQPSPEPSPTESVPGEATPTFPPPTVTPTMAPVPPVEEGYEDRGDPVSLLASYYNAVNRQEYERAYAYWETPPSSSYQEFVQGYADTVSVLLAVRPPTGMEGAAGSQYVSVRALLIATHVDGSRHSFVGCFVARRPNPAMGGEFAAGLWSLYSATVAPAPDNSTDATLLAGACGPASGQSQAPYDDRANPVSLLASYYDAVNRQEYERAYAYWEEAPSPSYEEFVQGYADTESVFLVVQPPTRFEGAAGSVYTAVATLLIAAHTDGSQHSFVGCFVARRSNVGAEGAPDTAWSLYNATVNAAPGNSTDVALLAEACATH
jgi:hypothetical protein